MHETMETLGADLRDAAEDMAVLASQIQSLKRAATSAATDGTRPSSAVPTPSVDFAIWAALKKAVTHLEAKHAEVEEAVSELDTRVEDRMEVNAQVIVRVSHAVIAKGNWDAKCCFGDNRDASVLSPNEENDASTDVCTSN